MLPKSHHQLIDAWILTLALVFRCASLRLYLGYEFPRLLVFGGFGEHGGGELALARDVAITLCPCTRNFVRRGADDMATLALDIGLTLGTRREGVRRLKSNEQPQGHLHGVDDYCAVLSVFKLSH